MEGHRAKLQSENDFDVSPFCMESSEARRLFTLNSREEKRLEKVRKNLEKQRAAEEKRFVKAQKDALVHFVDSRKRNSKAKVGIYEETKNNVWQPWTASQEQLLFSSSGNWDPQNTGAGKNYQRIGKHSQKVGIDYSPYVASNSFSVLPDMQRILASEGNFIQRSRSWSNQGKPNFRFLNKVGRDKVTGKQANDSAQRSLIQENYTEATGSEIKRKEASLSDVLPPVVLPPLHSQKNKTLKEITRRGTLKKNNQVKKEELWDGLEDCRYIRPYLKDK